MRVARHETGAYASLSAVASQIHPVFMLPPLAASWFGAMLALDVSLWSATIHSMAIFAAVYTAHVKDGYVDFYLRGEDEDHPLTREGCRICLVLATGLFAACVLILGVTIGWGAAAITAPTWFIGYFHAPQLDMHPLGATLGYPVGIGLALVGGFYVQATAIEALPLAFALVFVVLLAGIKIVDDEQDYIYDKSIGKPTVAVVLGRERARTLSTIFLTGAILLVLALVGNGTFPPGSLLAGLALGMVVLASIRIEPAPATALLIRGSYVFLALLIVAVWFNPL